MSAWTRRVLLGAGGSWPPLSGTHQLCRISIRSGQPPLVGASDGRHSDGILKPEMFANVTLYAGSASSAVDTPGLPRDAIIYEGENARVWSCATMSPLSFDASSFD